MSCFAEDIWESMMGEDEEDSDKEIEAEKGSSHEWEFVRDGGGAADGFSPLEHFG